MHDSEVGNGVTRGESVATKAAGAPLIREHLVSRALMAGDEPAIRGLEPGCSGAVVERRPSRQGSGGGPEGCDEVGRGDVPLLLAHGGEQAGDEAGGVRCRHARADLDLVPGVPARHRGIGHTGDRKSTRLNSSHPSISYAVFCLKKKTQMTRLV